MPLQNLQHIGGRRVKTSRGKLMRKLTLQSCTNGSVQKLQPHRLLTPDIFAQYVGVVDHKGLPRVWLTLTTVRAAHPGDCAVGAGRVRPLNPGQVRIRA